MVHWRLVLTLGRSSGRHLVAILWSHGALADKVSGVVRRRAIPVVEMMLKLRALRNHPCWCILRRWGWMRSVRGYLQRKRRCVRRVSRARLAGRSSIAYGSLQKVIEPIKAGKPAIVVVSHVERPVVQCKAVVWSKRESKYTPHRGHPAAHSRWEGLTSVRENSIKSTKSVLRDFAGNLLLLRSSH